MLLSRLASSLVLPRLRWSFLAAALTAPILATGCEAAVEDEEAVADESALSGRVFDEGTTLRVTANRLNVRARAGMSGRILLTLDRNDRVTVIQRSGGNGWVNIRTSDDQEGWAAGNYLTETESDEDDRELDTSTADGPTCDPARATGVVNQYQKALHDTIAYAEGTRDHSKDGYNVLFGFSTISSCARHPNRCIKFGSTCSTAAGRYQFLNRTWQSITNTRGYATFEPENQERGAAYLIASVRRASVPSDRPLTSAEFTNVITKLSYEWASLPPGQYGQPIRSMSQLRTVYCSLVDC